MLGLGVEVVLGVVLVGGGRGGEDGGGVRNCYDR